MHRRLYGFKLHPTAVKEATTIQRGFEHESTKRVFEKALVHALNQIRIFPEQFQRVSQDQRVRKAPIWTFSSKTRHLKYGVVYTVDEQRKTIIVLAINEVAGFA